MQRIYIRKFKIFVEINKVKLSRNQEKIFNVKFCEKKKLIILQT